MRSTISASNSPGESCFWSPPACRAAFLAATRRRHEVEQLHVPTRDAVVPVTDPAAGYGDQPVGRNSVAIDHPSQERPPVEHFVSHLGQPGSHEDRLVASSERRELALDLPLFQPRLDGVLSEPGRTLARPYGGSIQPQRQGARVCDRPPGGTRGWSEALLP